MIETSYIIHQLIDHATKTGTIHFTPIKVSYPKQKKVSRQSEKLTENLTVLRVENPLEFLIFHFWTVDGVAFIHRAMNE